MTMNFAAVEEQILGGTTARRGDAVFVRGEGCWLFDSVGRRYLDLIGTGRRDAGALPSARQRGDCGAGPPADPLPKLRTTTSRARFAAALVTCSPITCPTCFSPWWRGGGGRRVEVRAARDEANRLRFDDQGFHGRTMGAPSVTWEPKYRGRLLPLLDTTHVPFNDAAALDRAVGDSTAAVILEVVQGESGVKHRASRLSAGGAQLCRDRGALLIVDEIQTGFGRTGRWFAVEHADFGQTSSAMAKGLGGGFPMGALAYTESVRRAFIKGLMEARLAARHWRAPRDSPRWLHTATSD